jgi:hypothetical protein
MAKFARGERVEIVTPGWTGCRFGFVRSDPSVALEYCVERDDGYRHHYLYVVQESDLRAVTPAEPLRTEDERLRLPLCELDRCSLCSRVR